MKLTKQKLKQLIMEEYTRRISDEGRPTNYPQHADKLTRLAKSDYTQARSLADTLDDPLNIELDPDNMQTIGIDNFTEEEFDSVYMHNDFLGYANNYYRQNNTEADEIVPEQAYDYAKMRGLDPQKTLKNLQAARQNHLKSKTTGKFDAHDHMRKQGYDVEDYFE